MEPSVQHNPDEHRYELLHDDGTRIGLLDYRDRDGVLDLVHTEVDRAHGGQGYGNRLVKGALDDIRARGLTVVPSCPFVAAFIQRHDAYADLLAEA